MSFDSVSFLQVTEEMALDRFRVISQKIGHFPTKNELAKMQEWKLRNAISNLRKPISYYAQKLGYQTKQKTKNYWTEEKILSHLKEIQLLHGSIPSIKDFSKLNYSDLFGAIYRSGKSMSYYKEKLGESSPTYWDEVKIIEKLKEISAQLGRFPKQKELYDLKLKGLVGHINRSGESLHNYAIKLGFNPSQKSKGYWRSFENTKNELQLLIDQTGKFPTLDMIRSNIGSSIIFGIYNYHDNLPKVAEKMGYELNHYFKTTDGHYVQSSNEYLLDEFLYSRGIDHEVGGMIGNGPYFYDFKVGDFYIEIWGYEEERDTKICKRYKMKRKKKEEFYKKKGFKLISIERDIFKKSLAEIELYFTQLFSDLGFNVKLKRKDYEINNNFKHSKYWSVETVEKELKEVVEKLGKFPSFLELKAMNQGGLADAIKRFGGYVFFRKKLGYELEHKPDHYWDEQNIVDELKNIVSQINTFPTYVKLKQMERYDVIRAINKNGGFPKFQKLLGFEPKQKPKGYYTKEVLLKELKEAIDNLGFVPTSGQLRRNENTKTLISAIERSRLGFNNLIKELGYEPTGIQCKKIQL